MNRILVLGSLNIDLVQHVPRLPFAGETLQGSDLQIFAGGKGANQACAAAMLGGNVDMAGKVGNDVFGQRLADELKSAGVRTDSVRRSESRSGTAVIFVLPNGENLIVISPGANADVSVDFALTAVDSLQEGDFLLCQLEVPVAAVRAAIVSAYRKNVTTILDPAPARALPDELLSSISILTPNQTEAAVLLGHSQTPQELAQAESAARDLQARGPQTVIIKMGAAGCVVQSKSSAFAVRGFQVNAVDSTGAGDTFNGALAAALARGLTIFDAVRFANAAAALSVTKPGAIASIPRLIEVQEFLSLQSIA